LQWGKEKDALEEMQDAGMEVPALERRQSITGYEWLWDAYWELDTCRQTGMSVGPIPWTAIQQYAEAEMLNADETYMLHTVIRSMDKKFKAYLDEQTK
jgi:hypothetical protein